MCAERGGRAVARPASQECLDRLSIALGGKTMVPLVAKALPALLADADWRRRHAALMMLSQVAEAGAHAPFHDMRL